MSHFKQNEKYGCGVYAIANILQDESFITETRLLESKNGNHNGQLNKWLLEHGLEMYLDPFHFNHTGKRLPKSITSLKPFGDNVILIDPTEINEITVTPQSVPLKATQENNALREEFLELRNRTTTIFV